MRLKSLPAKACAGISVGVSEAVFVMKVKLHTDCQTLLRDAEVHCCRWNPWCCTFCSLCPPGMESSCEQE